MRKSELWSGGWHVLKSKDQQKKMKQKRSHPHPVHGIANSKSNIQSPPSLTPTRHPPKAQLNPLVDLWQDLPVSRAAPAVLHACYWITRFYPRHSTKHFPQNAAVLHAYYWIKGWLDFPNWMFFWKTPKRPLTPPSPFLEITLRFFLRKFVNMR